MPPEQSGRSPLIRAAPSSAARSAAPPASRSRRRTSATAGASSSRSRPAASPTCSRTGAARSSAAARSMPRSPPRSLTAADLAACTRRRGLLLSGVVRFSAASPPDPGAPIDAPLAFDVALALDGGAYRRRPCMQRRAVEGGALRRRRRPADRRGAGRRGARLGRRDELVRDRRSLHRLPLRGLPGSGRPLVGPHDAGRDAAGPSATAPPTAASAVTAPTTTAAARSTATPNTRRITPTSTAALANQNFLVVRGPDACPSGSAGARHFARATGLATLPHQP